MPRGESYAPKLKAALDVDLPALEDYVQPKDIIVTETPEGSYRVEVVIFVPIAEQEGKFTSAGIVRETYTDSEALETQGPAYREKTARLAQVLRQRWEEATGT